MPALAELEEAWIEARADEGFRAELDALLRDFAGRPTPLYHAAAALGGRRPPDLPQARGPPPHGRAQDQQRARPVPARQAHGQAADHRRDRRRPARRRHGDRVRAARPRVRRLHGHRGHAPPAAQRAADGAARARRSRPSTRAPRTLKEAMSAAIRDWVTNVGDTHYVIGSCVGPAPFPALVRDLQRVIGDEARAQMLERRGPPARPRDRLRRRRLERDRDLHRVPRRRGRRADRRRGRPATGIETGRHGAPLTDRRPRRRPARRLLGDHAGRGRPDPRGALDLGRPRLPGRRPRARVAARHRPGALRGRHRRRRARRRFRACRALEGIIPALESSHAVAWALGGDAGGGPDTLDLVCLSGRGDKDLAEVLPKLGIGD